MEKYRPKTFDEMMGQEDIISSLKSLAARFKKGEQLNHLLFIGPSGIGKTTAAYCLAREIWGDQWEAHFKEYNASDDRKIDDVRDKYKQISRHRGQRILYLDESDRMTPDAQHAMRRIMELTPSTIFVLSGNQGWRFIDAIKSRCTIYRFKRLDDRLIGKYLLNICRLEGIKVDTKSPQVREGFTLLVKEANGDMRWALNTLEKIVTEGKEVTPTSISILKKPENAVNAIMLALKGDWQSAKELMEDAYIMSGYSHEEIIEEIYQGLEKVTDEQIRIRLYRELGEVEGRCRYGNMPLIQLVSFVSYAWVAPRLTKCPALEGTQ